MRHDVEPLFEAIRCELVGVRNRLDARERGGPADRPGGDGRETARPVAVSVAAADRPARVARPEANREREVPVPLVVEATQPVPAPDPGRRGRRAVAIPGR